jgi:hypothetical protein
MNSSRAFISTSNHNSYDEYAFDNHNTWMTDDQVFGMKCNQNHFNARYPILYNIFNARNRIGTTTTTNGYLILLSIARSNDPLSP